MAIFQERFFDGLDGAKVATESVKNRLTSMSCPDMELFPMSVGAAIDQCMANVLYTSRTEADAVDHLNYIIDQLEQFRSNIQQVK